MGSPGAETRGRGRGQPLDPVDPLGISQGGLHFLQLLQFLISQALHVLERLIK